MDATMPSYNQSVDSPYDEGYYYYMYNDTAAGYSDEDAAAYHQMLRDRNNFAYVYHAFAAFIVVLNSLMLVAILVSRKQRRHFRNWLIIHMTCIHIVFGGIALPFMAQSFNSTGAGLGSVPLCKLFYFISDITEYMSNISIGILGVSQCLNLISTRLLKSVSSALLVSMMIILPWFVVVMLTAVLRLTMSEEQYGLCYIVSDLTAHILWFILSQGMPLTLVLACLVTILSLICTPFPPKTNRSPPGRYTVTVFVTICLGACLIMRTPFYIIFFEPIDKECKRNHKFLCPRLTHGLDIVRLLSMVVIPIAYLVQMDLRKRCKQFRSKLLCKTVDCSTNSKKQQTMEMVNITTNDNSSL